MSAAPLPSYALLLLLPLHRCTTPLQAPRNQTNFYMPKKMSPFSFHSFCMLAVLLLSLSLCSGVSELE